MGILQFGDLGLVISILALISSGTCRVDGDIRLQSVEVQPSLVPLLFASIMFILCIDTLTATDYVLEEAFYCCKLNDRNILFHIVSNTGIFEVTNILII